MSMQKCLNERNRRQKELGIADKDDKDGSKGNPKNQGGLPQQPNPGFLRRLPIVVVLLLIAAPWIISLVGGATGPEEVSYNRFMEEVRSGNVSRVTIVGTRVEGVFRGDTADSAGQSGQFVTYIPAQAPQDVRDSLSGNDVTIYSRPPQDGSLFGQLIWLLPLVIFGWIIYQNYRRMKGGGGGAGGPGGIFNVGQSKAKQIKSQEVSTRFDDVAGLHSAKTELKEIVDYLSDPDRFVSIGAKAPRGVLLMGPPGTGKTLLARAVAGEAGVPFFSMSGSDFMEMFVGVGASRVRDLFTKAKKKSPSIIFIDEFDSIGRRRGAGLGGGHDEREQTLNQMLAELDGFEKYENVVVLAATNRPDILDKALLRPGRFDRRITTYLPSMEDRLQILKLHARQKPVADEADIEAVARGTPGFSGADLENLLNEAALIAARSGKENVEQEDLDLARDKILLGLERKGIALSEHDKQLLAYHEAGHAVVSALLEHTEPLHKVTIIPRENSMGVTQQLPDRDRYLYEQSYLLDRLTVMMGGRASERLKMNTTTSGAENDLKEAQKLARKMVLDWGMSGRFQNIAFGGERQSVFLGQDIGQRRDYSEDTAHEVDQQVEEILTQAYERARNALEENDDSLEAVTEALVNKEEISGSEVYEKLGIKHPRK